MRILTSLILALLVTACSSTRPDRVSWEASEVPGLKIILHKNTDDEKKAKAVLAKILKSRRLDAYYFSPRVFLSSSAAGEGVPEPSLPARLAANEDSFLTEFLKTQLLYYAHKKHERFAKVLPTLKELFPKLPREAFTAASPSEPDLYRELMVHYLAFRALRSNFGEQKAAALLVGSLGNKVLQENAVSGQALLENILRKYQLIPEE